MYTLRSALLALMFVCLAPTTDLYKYSSRCRTSYSRRIISCSHG